MIRTFLAVDLTESIRGNLSKLQQDLKRRITGGLSSDIRLSWVQPASIHLTVRFFGEIDEQLVLPMQEAIGRVVGSHRPIHIPLERLDAFPRPQQPRVLWVGPSEEWERNEEAQRLASLHRAIEDCCVLFDFAPDSRPLNPHLTLARIRQGARAMGEVLAESGVMGLPLSLGSMGVDSIVLMKSDLQPAGSRYTKLWEVKIGG